MKMSGAKGDYLCDVKDAAFNAGPIYEVSKGLQIDLLVTDNPMDCPTMAISGSLGQVLGIAISVYLQVKGSPK
jgi:hypothetical protein